MHFRTWLAPSLLLVAVGCSDPAATAGEGGDAGFAEAPMRNFDFATVTRGGRLYQQFCARCHGAAGEGAPDWRQRDAEGFFPPPPVNGTGHAWHHSRETLHSVIANGSPAGGRMPAWRDQLSDPDISAIIDWFQSRWPDEVYAAWAGMQQRAENARATR